MSRYTKGILRPSIGCMPVPSLFTCATARMAHRTIELWTPEAATCTSRLRLLSTPALGDAVAFSYEGSAPSGRDLHPTVGVGS
ncbi:MAG: hypothetical protein WAM53_08730 [Terrimicrobiaceae bacterium]